MAATRSEVAVLLAFVCNGSSSLLKNALSSFNAALLWLNDSRKDDGVVTSSDAVSLLEDDLLLNGVLVLSLKDDSEPNVVVSVRDDNPSVLSDNPSELDDDPFEPKADPVELIDVLSVLDDGLSVVKDDPVEPDDDPLELNGGLLGLTGDPLELSGVLSVLDVDLPKLSVDPLVVIDDPIDNDPLTLDDDPLMLGDDPLMLDDDLVESDDFPRELRVVPLELRIVLTVVEGRHRLKSGSTATRFLKQNWIKSVKLLQSNCSKECIIHLKI